MAVYFDPVNSAGDKAMLPYSAQTSKDLANAAALAEASVISYYTGNPPYFLYTTFLTYVKSTESISPSSAFGLLGYLERGVGEDVSDTGLPSTAIVPNLRVYLAGYKADSADANVAPSFKAAMKRTIADVCRWYIMQWSSAQGLNSSSDMQAKVRQYRANADDAFPPDWNRWLIPYDKRPVGWCL